MSTHEEDQFTNILAGVVAMVMAALAGLLVFVALLVFL